MLPQNSRYLTLAAGAENGRKGLVIAAALSATALLAGPAAAVTAPAGSSTALTVAVTGHISPRCTVDTGQAANSSFGDITDRATGRAATATLDLPFTMTCNTPYVATLASRNGGLAYDGAGVPQFATLVSYSATLGTGEAGGGVSLSCDSGQMRATDDDGTGSTCHANSPRLTDAVAGQGRVKLRLHPGSEPLLRGVYQDQLVIKLSPVVSG